MPVTLYRQGSPGAARQGAALVRGPLVAGIGTAGAGRSARRPAPTSSPPAAHPLGVFLRWKGLQVRIRERIAGRGGVARGNSTTSSAVLCWFCDITCLSARSFSGTACNGAKERRARQEGKHSACNRGYQKCQYKAHLGRACRHPRRRGMSADVHSSFQQIGNSRPCISNTRTYSRERRGNMYTLQVVAVSTLTHLSKLTPAHPVGPCAGEGGPCCCSSQRVYFAAAA